MLDTEEFISSRQNVVVDLDSDEGREGSLSGGQARVSGPSPTEMQACGGRTFGVMLARACV